MSFDEKQYLDRYEIDLSELLKTIWLYKFTLLFFIFLSVPISVWVATVTPPKYSAETVFEKPSQKSSQRKNSLLEGFQGIGLNIFSLAGMESNSFFSEIRSESFLETVIINNGKLDSQIIKFCPLPSKEIPQFSLQSLLISLGISEYKDPSESQKISLLVKCVNKMLEVDLDTGSSSKIKSSAYRLSIESGNPNFAANLANKIVDKYFERHKTKREDDFQNVKKYLSKVITEAQLEFTEANKLLQNFIIKNALLMNIDPTFAENADAVNLPLPPSPFANKLKKDFFTLSQLEKNLNRLTQAVQKLSNLKDLNQDAIQKAISSSENQEVLSSTFVRSIVKIDNQSADTSSKNQKIQKIVSQQILSVRQQMQVLEEKISKREEQAIKLMTIENRFQELAIDVSKKRLIFEGLKDQLKEKILITGLANIEQPVLLTKAVPPFTKASPNRPLIVVLGVLLSIFVGFAYALIRQLSTRRVHSLSQLRRLSKFLNCYEIKYKQLMNMRGRSDETIISQSFFALTMGIGKVGCIIDLSQKRQNDSLASKFARIFTSFLVTDSTKIAFLESSPSNTLLPGASFQKNYSSGYSDINEQGILRKNISMFNDEEDMIGAGEVKKIKNKYSDYDKIICALGAEIGDITKFKFIEKCDFYILIGRSFHFDEYTYKKFSNTVWEKEKKCLGFFLID